MGVDQEVDSTQVLVKTLDQIVIVDSIQVIVVDQTVDLILDLVETLDLTVTVDSILVIVVDLVLVEILNQRVILDSILDPTMDLEDSTLAASLDLHQELMDSELQSFLLRMKMLVKKSLHYLLINQVEIKDH